jgi:AcrR family transcriptional regulator
MSIFAVAPSELAQDVEDKLRARQRAHRRRAVVEASLELFAERGYDNTMVEEIAQRAGVSPRTFFRYFETKDSVLFFGGDDYFRSLSEIYVGQPSTLGDLEALEASFIALVPHVTPLHRRVRLYYQALATSAALRGRDADILRSYEAQLADLTAARRRIAQADEECELVASLGLMLSRRALSRWTVTEPPGDLAAFISVQFATATALMGSTPRGTRPSKGGAPSPGRRRGERVRELGSITRYD